MTAKRPTFPWIWVSVGATVVVVGLVALVRIPRSAPLALASPAAQPHPMSVSAGPAVDAASNLRTELLYEDPTPLFLPTRWNTGRVDPSMTAERSPGTSFATIPAKFFFPPTEFQLDVPDVVAVPQSALAALNRIDHRVALTELARRDPVVARLPARAGLLEVRGIQSGQVLRRIEIPRSEMTWSVREPLELLVIVDRAGLIAQPTVVKSTDEVAVDLGEVSNLLKSVHLGGFLGAGIYRILLGP